MSNKLSKHPYISTGITLSLFFALHSAFGTFITTQERGSNFLAGEGFSNVSGGGSFAFYLNQCGRHAYSRDYQVTNGLDEDKNIRVCMSSGSNSYFEIKDTPKKNTGARPGRRR